MPRTSITTVTALELEPKVKADLVTTLREFEAVQASIKALEAEAAALKMHVEGIANDADLSQALEAGMEVDGYKVKVVHPTRDTLDVKKLIAQGVTTEQIASATVTKPTKSYLSISAPRAPKQAQG